jgi:hypothetical protein
MKKRPTKTIPRNSAAIPAKSRTSGSMKHRAEPRKGAKNDQPELLMEADPIFTAVSHCEGMEVTGDQYCMVVNGNRRCNCSCVLCQTHTDDTECDA